MQMFEELKRRNVFRVGLAYAMVSWLVLQITDVAVPLLELPRWAGKLVFLLLAVGLPIVLVIAWAFEVTPTGIKLQSELDKTPSARTPNHRRLDIVIMGVMAVALTYFAINHDWGGSQGHRDIGTASGQSIAVLPFVNRSALDGDEFFVDGVHDDLLTLLSRLGDLKVISRTSVEQFRGTRLSIPEVARKLGVATVLEGSVQRAGGQVHINVQLIDAANDEHLWAEAYDRELTAENMFAIQGDIANVIAQALQAVLTIDEQSRVANVPTLNFAAYEEYLRGRQKLVSREIPDLRQAVDHFHTAIRLDPDYAMAYAGLAEVYQLLLNYGDMSAAETVPLMDAAVNSALGLDPKLGEAQLAKAFLLQVRGLGDETVITFEKAIELAPGYAPSYHRLGEHFRGNLNRPDLALPLIRSALELDPLSPVINITLAEVLSDLARYDEALEQADHTIEIAPTYASAYNVKAQFMAFLFGRLDQALELYEYSAELDPHSVGVYVNLAQMYSQLGDDALAISYIEHGLELGPEYIFSHFTATEVYLVAGDRERALRHARKAHALEKGFWFPKRVLRDAEIDNGQAAVARARYESFDPEFVGDKIPVIHSNNVGAAVDYAYLLLAAGEDEELRRILLPTLDYLSGATRLGIRGMGIDEVRVLAMLGERDRALETLAQIVAEGWRLRWRVDIELPSLDSIRDDPRFQVQRKILEADMATQLETYRSNELN